MTSRTLSRRLQYRFEERMARSGGSVFMALMLVFVASLVAIGVIRALVVHFVGEDVERGSGPFRQVFLVFLELTDPGSMTQDVDSGVSVKVFTVLAGLIGVVLFSSLIAFITAAVDRRLAELRKGRTQVFESDHTLILGWNDRIVEIVAELVIANESEERPAIVILADRDKEAMDDYLSLHLPDTKNTRVITRAGSESSRLNHRTVGLADAKSVIILAGCNAGSTASDKTTSDMAVVKTVVAVTSSLGNDVGTPIVAELFDRDKRELARSIDPDRVVCLDTDSILAKIIVQTSRTVGLAVVYEEILSFDGAELYLLDAAPMTGHRFGDAVYRMADGVPIGLCFPNGRMKINPGREVIVEIGARLIVLASDDSTLGFRDEPARFSQSLTPIQVAPAIEAERQLVIGRNAKLPALIAEYGEYAVQGSRIDVISRRDNSRVLVSAGGGSPVQVAELDIDPMDLEQLSSLDLRQYDSVIVLSEEHDVAPEEWIDTETLMELLQLQRLVRKIPEDERPKLVVEILGSESRDLVTSSGVREFVISNRMISMLVAQISETPELRMVYDDLFAEDGSEIYLKDASHYCSVLPSRSTFASLVAAASERDEIAIGIRRNALTDCEEQNFGVLLIPDLEIEVELELGDAVVVVAENEH